MRILLVEDAEGLGEVIQEQMTAEGHAIDWVQTISHAETSIHTTHYDLILLDLMLPDGSGIDLLKQIRQSGATTPVIILTARDQISDRIKGLNAGADDYLVKPFAFVELIARVRALLRRPQQTKETNIVIDGLELDRDNFVAIRNNQRIELSAKEFALLEYLMSSGGRIVNKDQIMQHVWDYDADILPNTVEVYIGYLRNKLDKPFPHLPKLIHTRRGFGYYFGIKK